MRSTSEPTEREDVPSGIDRVPELVSRLYAVVDELETLFPGRHFTPDGHLVGSLGEVWAAHLYGIALHPASSATHDGLSPSGKQVQVKATQGSSVALSSVPDHLVVLRLQRHGNPEEYYNGPGALAWHAAGKMQKNGQRSVSLTKLRRLMESVGSADRIPWRPS